MHTHTCTCAKPPDFGAPFEFLSLTICVAVGHCVLMSNTCDREALAMSGKKPEKLNWHACIMGRWMEENAGGDAGGAESAPLGMCNTRHILCNKLITYKVTYKPYTPRTSQESTNQRDISCNRVFMPCNSAVLEYPQMYFFLILYWPYLKGRVRAQHEGKSRQSSTIAELR